MSAPKAYVLIRTSLTSIDACVNSKHYGYFKECLNSVLSQSFEDISILLLQDARTATKGGVKKTPLPQFCSKICDGWQRTSGTRFNWDLHFYSTTSEYSDIPDQEQEPFRHLVENALIKAGYQRHSHLLHISYYES